MSKLILALDQGTGGTKAVLFDEQGELVAKGFTPLASQYPDTGFVEQNPEDILDNVLTAVRHCLAQAAKSEHEVKDRVAAVGISNQRETFLLWDTQGTPLCNALVWQDKRAVSICNTLKDTEAEALVRRKTGLIIDPYFSGGKLAWLIQNDPKIKQAVRSGVALFGTVDTWLLFRLTRGNSYYSDYTNASRTLLFDINSLSWDESLIKSFDVEGVRLPRTTPSSFAFGHSTFEGLFPKPIPISGMIGDSHAAAFGEGCFKPGQAKATLGTGSSILCNIGFQPTASSQGMVTTICWATQERVDYALEGIIVSCGATIKWLRDQLGIIASSRQTEEMANKAGSNGGVYFIPGFSGMGAPHWKMDARGSIVGLTFGADKNHVARAALEAVAFQIKDVIKAMEKDSGTTLSELKLDGGMTSNTFLIQLIADLLGVRTVCIGLEEVTALGAAYMAGLGAGVYKSLDDLPVLHSKQTSFEPRAECGDIKQNYQTWLEMVSKHC